MANPSSQVFMQSVLFSFMLKLFQMFLGEHLLLVIVPKKFKKGYLLHKVRDLQLEDSASTNGAAALHALIVTPICIFEAVRLWMYDDIFTGESIIMEFLMRFMMGFFLWDMFECYTRFHIYGLAFTVHAIFSYLGLLFTVIAPSCKMFGVIAFVGGSELSTMFLHFRWITIQAKMTDTIIFRVMSSMSMITFIGYRLILLPFFVFPLILKELVYLPTCPDIAQYRQISLIVFVVTSAALNYFWGLKFMKSYFKKRTSAAQTDTQNNTQKNK